MKKETFEEFTTKAQKRAQKHRPRMKMHGRNLKLPTAHAGKKLIKK